MVLVGPIALLFLGLTIIYPGLKAYAALWDCLVFLDILVIDHLQRSLKTTSGKNSRDFDCDILHLGW
jgi:hypothetical protein